MSRPLAYITGDFGDEEFDARAVAAKYCRFIYEAGYSPICPSLFQPYFLKPKRAQEYKDGRDMANELLRRSRILVVCGDSESEETLADIAIARRLRIATTTFDGIVEVSKIVSELGRNNKKSIENKTWN